MDDERGGEKRAQQPVAGEPGWFMAMLFRGEWIDFHLAHEVGNAAKEEEVRQLLAAETRHDEARLRPLVNASMRRVRLETLARQVAICGIYGRQDRRFLGDAKYLRRAGGRVIFIDHAGPSRSLNSLMRSITHFGNF